MLRLAEQQQQAAVCFMQENLVARLLLLSSLPPFRKWTNLRRSFRDITSALLAEGVKRQYIHSNVFEANMARHAAFSHLSRCGGSYS